MILFHGVEVKAYTQSLLPSTGNRYCLWRCSQQTAPWNAGFTGRSMAKYEAKGLVNDNANQKICWETIGGFQYLKQKT